MSSLSRLLHRAFSTSQQPTTTTIKSLSNDLYKERNLKRLVQKFKKYSERDRFRTRTGIYEDTVRHLASAGRLSWIEEILEDQKKYKDINSEGFTARIISLYGKAGMFEHARKSFDEMPERNCKQTALSFNSLLGACVNSKKFDIADGLFRELPNKLGIEPDLVSYNTVIKAFCGMGSLDSGILILDEMEKKGVEPDLITFNTLLNEFYGKGQFLDGEKVWRRMVEKGLIPDIRSYNARLLGLALEKRTDEAVELVEEMRKTGMKPDVFSFNALIKGFVNEGKLEDAKRSYGEMEKSDCAPNKISFATLIPFICDKGDLDFAFELCREIFSRKCLVDAALLQLVVDGLAKDSRIKQAEEIMQLGRRNSYRRYNLVLPSAN